MGERGWWAERAADAELLNRWDQEDDMARGRTTRAREKRALARKPPVTTRKAPRRAHVPTGGGVFFRAGERTAGADPELIRDVFRRTLSGTALGRALGY